MGSEFLKFQRLTRELDNLKVQDAGTSTPFVYEFVQSIARRRSGRDRELFCRFAKPTTNLRVGDTWLFVVDTEHGDRQLWTGHVFCIVHPIGQPPSLHHPPAVGVYWFYDCEFMSQYELEYPLSSTVQQLFLSNQFDFVSAASALSLIHI